MSKLKNLTKEEFKILYDSMSQKQLSKTLNVTIKTVMKRVAAYDLPRKPKGRPIHNSVCFKDETQSNPEVDAILKKLTES